MYYGFYLSDFCNTYTPDFCNTYTPTVFHSALVIWYVRFYVNVCAYGHNTTHTGTITCATCSYICFWSCFDCGPPLLRSPLLRTPLMCSSSMRTTHRCSNLHLTICLYSWFDLFGYMYSCLLLHHMTFSNTFANA